MFLFLGIGIFSIKHPFSEMGLSFLLTSFLNVNIARALNIFIVTWIVNRYRSVKTQFNFKK